MRTIIVTGNTGFIGQNLVRFLEKLNLEYRVIKNLDILVDDDWLRNNNYQNGPYLVYHLAAKTGVKESWCNFQEVFDSNVRGTQRVLEFSKLTGSSMVFLSSAHNFGSANGMNESQLTSIDNPYALSKSLAENLCNFYSKQYDIPITILRLFNVYGPGQSNKFLIPHLISEFLNKKEITVENLNGERDYIYVDDVVTALLKSSRDAPGCEVFNVGTGKAYSVKEIIQMLSIIVGENKNVVDKKQERKNEVLHSCANIEKIRSVLSWEPKIDLEEGLRRTVQALEDSQDMT